MSKHDQKPIYQAINFDEMSPEERKAYHEKLLDDAKRKEAAKAKEAKKEKASKKANATTVPGQAPKRILSRRLDGVESKPVRWLWPGRIACGKVTLIAGDPGLGKSQISAALAGIVTTGGLWPVDNVQCRAGSVIFLSSEDDAADTIRPRLEAVGADLSKCVVFDGIQDFDTTGAAYERDVNLKNDLALLEKEVIDIGDVRLIVIDPITAYLGGVDSHKNSDVRALLSPLGKFAERHGLAILGVSHLNKSAGQDALLRVNGSLAFVAAARAAYIVVKDKTNPARRLLLPMKNNLAKDIGGLAFSIVDAATDDGIETSLIEWEKEAVTLTADEALNMRTETDTERDDAKRFLLNLLKDGLVPAKDVEEAAETEGYSWRTIARAKAELGIKSQKDGVKKGWLWALPEECHAEECQLPSQDCGILGILRTDQGFQGQKYGKNSEECHANGMASLEKNATEKGLQKAPEKVTI